MKLKEWIKEYILICLNYVKVMKHKPAFLVCTPIHSNLGDHAIALSALDFLKINLKDTPIIEITQPVIRKNTWMFRWMTYHKLVLICGGGYIGSMWPDDNKMVTDVLKNFTNSKIIILPQTIYYECSDNLLYKKSRIVYSRHKNLTICVRDKGSVKWANRLCSGKSNVILTPDLVTMLGRYNEIENDRNGIILCLRADREQVVDYECIKGVLKKQSINIKTINNISNIYPIMPHMREKVLSRHLSSISRSKIFITDRLHGMLFATITGTPCIALNNKSNKVKGGYKWVKNNEYVRFVESANDFEENLKELLEEEKNHYYDMSNISSKFEQLKDIIRKQTTI